MSEEHKESERIFKYVSDGKERQFKIIIIHIGNDIRYTIYYSDKEWKKIINSIEKELLYTGIHLLGNKFTIQAKYITCFSVDWEFE